MLLATASGAQETPAHETVTVSEHVVAAIQDNGSNLVCVATDGGLVFFDTSLSTRTARDFRDEMEQRFQQRTRALVLTHAHLDHFLGMGAFSDVPVYAAAAGKPRWERYLAATWTDEETAAFARVFPTFPVEIEDAVLRLPTDWFGDRLELGTEEAPLSILRTGGHTVDSSVATVPADGVVIAGDLVQAARRPYFGEPDTDLEAWVGALEEIEAAGTTAVCGGHGPVIDAAEVGRIRSWFEEAIAATKVLKRSGKTPEEIFTGTELPTGYWPEEEVPPRWWGSCVMRLYDAS